MKYKSSVLKRVDVISELPQRWLAVFSVMDGAPLILFRNEEEFNRWVDGRNAAEKTEINPDIFNTKWIELLP
jgi:hypothetical protein